MRQRDRISRSAFTLLELMVVMVIIALLTALSAGMYIKFAANANVEATRMLLQTINDELQSQYEAFLYSTRQMTPITGLTVGHDPGGTPNAVRDRLASRIEAMRSEFPQEFSDFLQDAFTTNANMPEVRQQYIKFFNENFRPASHEPSTESAACLYMILRFNQRSGTTSSLDHLPPRNIRDTDGDGMPEIIDAWGRPVRFFRWPVDLIAYFIEVEGSLPPQMMVNTLDRDGVLLQPAWYAEGGANNGIGRDDFENAAAGYVAPPAVNYPSVIWTPPTSITRPPARYRYYRLHAAYGIAAPLTANSLPDPGQPRAYPILPVVVSAGPDNRFGFFDENTDSGAFDPTAVTGIGAATWLSVRCGRPDPTKLDYFGDNMVSLKLRSAGGQ